MKTLFKLITFALIVTLLVSIQTATRAAALWPASAITVTGTVRDSSFGGHTYPLYARLVFSIAGSVEAVVYSDPFTGLYRTSLVQGQTYTVVTTAVSTGYYTDSTVLTPVNNPTTLDILLSTTGDCSAPGYTDEPILFETFDQVNAPGFPANWSDTPINASTSHWSTAPNVYEAVPGFSSPNSLMFNAVSANSYTRLAYATGLDLQSHLSAAVSFWLYQTSLNPGTHDTIQLVVSDNAGQSWTPIDLPIERYSAATGWEFYRIDISGYAGAGKPLVQIGFQAFTGGAAPLNKIYLDNIRVASADCNVIPGGIIAGLIKNSRGNGVSQARVYRAAAPATDFTYSFTTPADPKIGGSLYWLFSGTSGSNDITVLQSRYSPKTASVNVVPETINRLDFALESAEFNFKPSPVTVEVVGTASASQNLTITNFGHYAGGIWLNETTTSWPAVSSGKAATTRLKLQTNDRISEIPAQARPAAQPQLSAAPSFQAAAPTVSSQLPSEYAAAIPGKARIRSAVASCDGRSFFLFGGQDSSNAFLNETWKFDTESENWTRKANMPVALMNMNAVCLDNSIYLVGGYNLGYTDDMLVYDTLADTWVQSSWPHLRTPMLAAHQGVLYAFGGAPISNETYAYTPVGGWVRKADMPTAVSFGSAVTVNEHIYVVGGVDVVGIPMNTVQRYDPQTDSWESNGPNLPEGRSNGSAVWYGDNTIYLFGSGGRAGDAWSAWNDGLYYDTALWPNGSWNRTPAGILSTPMDAGAGICLNGRIWLLGGVDANTLVPNAIAVYNTNQFLDFNQTCHPSLPGVPWLSLNPRTLSLGAGDSGQVSLTFNGANVNQAGLYRAILRINSDSPLNYLDIPVQMVRVEKGAGIAISPQSAAQTGQPHRSVTYHFTVTNTSANPTNFPITYTNASIPAGWAVTITPNSTGTLDPAGSKQISVQVTLPGSGVSDGTIFPLNLAIGSSLDPIHYGTATFITTLDYYTILNPLAFR